MAKSDIDTIKSVVKAHWPVTTPGAKAKRYVGEFFDLTRRGKTITGRVEGNHGIYTVSLEVKAERLSSACSCYIGAYGNCHHCQALGFTFLQDARAFKATRAKSLKSVRTPEDLNKYLNGVTLEKLLSELKTKGITQKAFAESIGMNSRHLTSVKSCELRNRYYNELGAIKLACLWFLEHIENKK